MPPAARSLPPDFIGASLAFDVLLGALCVQRLRVSSVRLVPPVRSAPPHLGSSELEAFRSFSGRVRAARGRGCEAPLVLEASPSHRRSRCLVGPFVTHPDLLSSFHPSYRQDVLRRLLSHVLLIPWSLHANP